MKTYISILRGINVSGQRMIKMGALKNVYEALHFENVKTYIQSGNVIFQSKNLGQPELEAIISTQIQKEFGFEVPVIVIDIEELKAIISKNPYANNASKNEAYLHLTFLASIPKQINIDFIEQKIANGEEFKILERAIYLYCPNGYGLTKLTNTFFENTLKVTATTRNWKTTKELLNIAKTIRE